MSRIGSRCGLQYGGWGSDSCYSVSEKQLSEAKKIKYEESKKKDSEVYEPRLDGENPQQG
jgi:hypothetical protein